MADEKGPNLENLRNLSSMLGSLQTGLVKGQIGGMGRPARIKPEGVCRICSALCSKGPEGEIETVCKKCDELLKEGYVALVSPEYYGFMKSSKLADKAGQIIKITEETMHAVRHQKGINGGKRNQPNDPSPEPPPAD